MKIFNKSYFNNFFMREAFKEAQLAFYEDEIPIGAVIVNRINKKIISKAHNIVEQKKNPLFHAEIVAINQACKILSNKNLSDYDIYVTLEPCFMCAAAISYARIGRLFYAANDYKQGAVENGIRFFTNKSCYHRPETYIGLSEDLSELLIKKFFNKIRFKKSSIYENNL